METFHAVVTDSNRLQRLPVSHDSDTSGYLDNWEQTRDSSFLFTVQVTHEKVIKPNIFMFLQLVFFKCI